MLKIYQVISLTLLLLSAVILLPCSPTEAAAKQPTSAQATAGEVQKKAAPQKSGVKTTAGDAKLTQLQQLLAATGYYPGAMNGILDSTTKDAISKAQRNYKLAPTGKYDPKLIDMLKKEARTKPTSYRKKITMHATAYTSQDPGSGNLTKREHPLRPGLVAVDPRIIPLGTRLYIEGYGYAVADDIGSAIKGNRIDLAYENRKDALQFGRKQVTVLILD